MIRARLQAAITGRAREVGPIEAHERTVMAVAAKITRRKRRIRELLAALKAERRTLKHEKREFRALLQRSSTVTEEQLAVAGHADGADRAIALAEHRVTHNHLAGEPCNALSCPVARHTSHPSATPIREEWPGRQS